MPNNELNLIDIIEGGFFYENGKFLFKNLNFNVKRGETTAILGLNGQGKSTLMFCMMGILKFKEGEILSNAKFAFLPQNFSVAFDYKVIDIVIMGRVREISLFSKPSKEDIKICKNALDTLGILGLANKSFNSLSGGQKQLALFARAIASESEILFLDEPASALDLKNQDRVLNLIRNLKERGDTGIVFTTHQPNHALAVADNTLILKNDLSYTFGKSDEILTDRNLTSLYGVDIRRTEFEFKNSKIPSVAQIFSVQKTR